MNLNEFYGIKYTPTENTRFDHFSKKGSRIQFQQQIGNSMLISNFSLHFRVWKNMASKNEFLRPDTPQVIKILPNNRSGMTPNSLEFDLEWPTPCKKPIRFEFKGLNQTVFYHHLITKTVLNFCAEKATYFTFWKKQDSELTGSVRNNE